MRRAAIHPDLAGGGTSPVFTYNYDTLEALKAATLTEVDDMQGPYYGKNAAPLMVKRVDNARGTGAMCFTWNRKGHLKPKVCSYTKKESWKTTNMGLSGK